MHYAYWHFDVFEKQTVRTSVGVLTVRCITVFFNRFLRPASLFPEDRALSPARPRDVLHEYAVVIRKTSFIGYKTFIVRRCLPFASFSSRQACRISVRRKTSDFTVTRTFFNTDRSYDGSGGSASVHCAVA